MTVVIVIYTIQHKNRPVELQAGSFYLGNNWPSVHKHVS